MRFDLLRQLRRRPVMLAGLGCALVALILWVALGWRHTVADQPLLGAWSLEGPFDVPEVSAVLCEFRADHTCRISLVLDPRGAVVNSQPGRWRLSGSVLVIDYDLSPYGDRARPGQEPVRERIVALDDDRLVFARADGQQVVYRRYRGGLPD